MKKTTKKQPKKKTIKKPKKQEKKDVEISGKNKVQFQKLVKLIDEIGDWNINYLDISRKWNIPQTTIHRWKEKIMLNRDPIDPTALGEDIMRGLKSAIRQANIRMKDASSEGDRIKWANTLGNLSQRMTDVLEAYGKKEKVADKHSFDGAVDFEFMRRVYDETKQVVEKK